MRSRSWIHFMWFAWLATLWTGADDAFRPRCMGTAVGRTIRCIGPDGPCTPVPDYSPRSRPTGSRPCSPTNATLRSKRPGASTNGWSPRTERRTGNSAGR